MDAGTPRILPTRTPGRKIKSPKPNHIVVPTTLPNNRIESAGWVPEGLKFHTKRRTRNIPLTGTPIEENESGKKEYSATYTRKNAAGNPLPVNFTAQARAERERLGKFSTNAAMFAANAAQQGNTLNQMIQHINLSPLERVLSGYAENKKQKYRNHYKKKTINQLIKGYLMLVPGIRGILSKIIGNAAKQGTTLEEKLAAVDMSPIEPIFTVPGLVNIDGKQKSYMLRKYKEHVDNFLIKQFKGGEKSSRNIENLMGGKRRNKTRRRRKIGS